ncbi:MAG: NAD-dependent epimerase/dehydratase family protein [Bradyrhizobium sp.]
MKILVFGGTGFVGLNIAAALLVRGHTVTLFDRALTVGCSEGFRLSHGPADRHSGR